MGLKQSSPGHWPTSKTVAAVFLPPAISTIQSSPEHCCDSTALSVQGKGQCQIVERPWPNLLCYCTIDHATLVRFFSSFLLFSLRSMFSHCACYVMTY